MALPNIIQQINSKLPLSGGTINGDITLSTTSTKMWNFSTDKYKGFEIAVGGQHESTGASLNLYHKDSPTSPGCFFLCAADGTNKSILWASASGLLTWRGNDVITSAGGDINGVIRFRNGSYIARSFSNENTSGASELSISALSDTSDPYTGASIYLHDINDTRGNTQGGFFIYARNTKEKECGLCGYTDGTLTWNNKNVVCVTSWSSGTSWYRKYSDGWIEQGGSTYLSSNPCNLTFHLTFSNTNYTFVGFYRDIDDNSSITNCAYRTKYTSYIRLVQGYNGTSYPDTIMWYACGY